MTGSESKTVRKPGRPRSEEARKALLAATAHLMELKPIRNITIASIADEAGVGKPTIYRWWDSKCSIVMDAFLSKVETEMPPREDSSVVDAVTQQVLSVVDLMRGRSGRIVAEIVGEGQSDPHVLEEFRDRFFSQLLAPTRAIIEEGKRNGELDPDLDADVALDLIFGPIYYRLLIGHQPLSGSFADALPKTVAMALARV